MKTVFGVVLFVIGFAAWRGETSPIQLNLLTAATKHTDRLGEIWSNCGKSTDMSIIKNVTITPDPPTKKSAVTIDAYFTLKENITGGSFTAKVKYGFLPEVTQTLQLCDLAKMAGLECPISQKTNHIHVSQKIPSIFPSGHYTGQVIGVDQNGKRLGCINIDVRI